MRVVRIAYIHTRTYNMLPLLALGHGTGVLSDKDMKLLERLEEADDRRRSDEERDESAKGDDTLLDAFIAAVRQADQQVRSRNMFRSLEEQDREIGKERARLLPAVGPMRLVANEALQRLDDESEFRVLLNGLYRKRKLQRRVELFEELFEELSPELKVAVLTRMDEEDNIVDTCATILQFCATNRNMCTDDVWEDIATRFLKIPYPKPDTDTWNKWISGWCRKLSAYSPWSSTMREPVNMRYSGDVSPDYDAFLFTKEECIWRLKNTALQTPVGGAMAPMLEIDYQIMRTGSTDPATFLYAEFAPFWPDDDEWVKEALRHDGRILEHVSDSIKDNEVMVRLACSSNPRALAFASDRLLESGAFIRSFMFSQPDILMVDAPEGDDLQIQSIRYQIAETRNELRAVHETSGWEMVAGVLDEDDINGYMVAQLDTQLDGTIFVMLGTRLIQNSHEIPPGVTMGFYVEEDGSIATEDTEWS